MIDTRLLLLQLRPLGATQSVAVLSIFNELIFLFPACISENLNKHFLSEIILLWAPSKLPFNNHNYYCLLSFVYHLYEFKNLQTQLVDDRFSLRDKALHTYLQQEKRTLYPFIIIIIVW